MKGIKHLLLVFLIYYSVALQHSADGSMCIVNDFNQVINATQSCKDIILDNLKVPGGQLLSLSLSPGTTLTLRGNISFGYYEWKGPLVNISGTDFLIKGEEGSLFDGQGPLWWDGQGTWGNTTKPKFIHISAQNASFENIQVMDCPVSCVDVMASSNLVLRHWRIDVLKGDEGVAPTNKFGHNTDGFGIGSVSNNILLEDITVYNQDDCVTISSGHNITLRRMFCHGSHGLTISGQTAVLTDVLIEDSIITMAENGIHIKTHIDSIKGLISNVTYRNITLLDCKNYGINIQQNYRNLPAGQPQDNPPKNNIPIHNLNFINIYGNVLAGAVPVYILCAEEGCFDWKWENVKILGARSNNCTNYVPEGYMC